MALNEALKQYMKCLECHKHDTCTDTEIKIKEAMDQPMYPVSKYFPSKGISGQPYKSKYFDDHRYDPPKPMTLCDVERYLIGRF